MAKEEKNPTHRYSLNFSNDAICLKEFCQKQSNLTDSIRYLIEEDIKKNGIRNLQESIPAVRPKLEIDNGEKESNISEISEKKGQHKTEKKTIISDCYDD